MKRRVDSAGFALIELLIASVVLLLVMGAATVAVLDGPRAFSTGSIRSSLRARAARCLDRISAEVMWADLDSLTGLPMTPLFDETVDFDLVEEVAGDGSVTWTTTRIALEASPEDPNDGVDNDDDGVVDECRVVMYRGWGEPDQQAIVLCSGVSEYLEDETPNGTDQNGNGLIDERGLCFERAQNRLTIRLSVTARDSEGRTIVQTVTTTVRIRN